MIKGKLKCGFDVEVPDENLDDYELFESLADLEHNDTEAVFILRRLLGTEQHDALKECLRDESGKVRVTAVMEALEEIFSLNDEAKNL